MMAFLELLMNVPFQYFIVHKWVLVVLALIAVLARAKFLVNISSAFTVFTERNSKVSRRMCANICLGKGCNLEEVFRTGFKSDG